MNFKKIIPIIIWLFLFQGGIRAALSSRPIELDFMISDISVIILVLIILISFVSGLMGLIQLQKEKSKKSLLEKFIDKVFSEGTYQELVENFYVGIIAPIYCLLLGSIFLVRSLIVDLHGFRVLGGLLLFSGGLGMLTAKFILIRKRNN